jgi:hypothetical protein
LPDDYSSAAKRHSVDAKTLSSAARYDNAGHLIGFAAECAMKYKLRALHKAPTLNFEGHHPRPQTMIRQFLQGRRLAGPWLALVSGSPLFNDWRIDDRYAPDGTVTKDMYDAWEASAEKIMNMAGIR